MNPYDEMRSSLLEARAVFSAADYAAGNMGEILKGRLRHIPPYILKSLKREIQDFNANTGKWKEESK